MKTISVRLVVGEETTNICLGGVFDAVDIEAIVSNADLASQFVSWLRHVPENYRIQVFAALTDSALFRDKLAKMLEE